NKLPHTNKAEPDRSERATGIEPAFRSPLFDDSLGRMKMNVEKCPCTSADVMRIFMTVWQAFIKTLATSPRTGIAPIGCRTENAFLDRQSRQTARRRKNSAGGLSMPRTNRRRDGSQKRERESCSQRLSSTRRANRSRTTRPRIGFANGFKE